jgi:xanthine dehydrogenase D subunit
MTGTPAATRAATAPDRAPTHLTQGSQTPGGIGESTLRPDGTLKVTGEFAFSSDMWHEDMLWGHTLRSPHPHAEIVSLDTSAALAQAGVYAVLTYDDLPTDVRHYGLEIPDTPVLAHGRVRHHGEPVAIVAADHPETARRAAAKIHVEYRTLPVVHDEDSALGPDAPLLHPGRADHHAARVPHPNVVHRQPIRRGDVEAARRRADVIVHGDYEVGMQDQAFLGPESGLAVPAEDGGVDLYIATQWLHADLRQIAPVLGLPEDRVRMTLSGVGGAFGGREDLSMQIHACLLALRTGKPVKMVYNRFESFFGHVHRHPARIHYEHGATRDGKLTHMACRIVLDGGAYASSSPAVVGNASSLSAGPYVIDAVDIEALALYTNNPPCGAMRGFGAVQACFAYEAQMDRVAAELGMDPVEFRQLNAMSRGTVMPTGQEVDSPAPVAEILRRVKAMPLPPERQWELAGAEGADLRALPGGLSNTTHGEGVVRGVGYAVGIKNVGFSEGFDDYSTARVRLEVAGGEAVAMVHTAMAEVGQGGVTVHAQIARTELGVSQVTIHPADTHVGSAGSTSASRQTYVTGGAVKHVCELVREKVLQRGREKLGTHHPAWAVAELLLEGGKVVTDGGEVLASIADVLEDEVVECESEWRHRPTEAFDLRTGQGFGHVQYSFAAHRAVVEVDTELGLVKVVELACAQDVGKAMNPQSVAGQIQGGSTQGLGLAVMEEIVVEAGKVRNPSFTDYLIPTILDTPTIPVEILELADEHAPYGLRGAGEAPTLSSTPAVLSAIRQATGLALNRVPVRPEHLTGT